MTFHQFRTDPERVKQLRQALQSPIMAEALHTMIENGPEKRVVPWDVSPHVAQMMLGQSRGYAEFHTTLLMLATHAKPNETVPATYEPAEE